MSTQTPSAGRWPATLAVGAVSGLMIAAIVLSLSTLVYSGPAARHVATGSALLLIGTAILNLVTARWSSVGGAVLLPQDATSAVAAVTLAAILPGVVEANRLGTTLAYLLISTLVTGAVMLLLGLFRLGDLVRFVPYPVIGGFLAGTGWLLIRGATDIASDGFRWRTATVIGLGAAVVFGAVMVTILRLRPVVFMFPAMLMGGAALFYALLALTGTSIDQARAQGLLPQVGTAELGLSLEAAGSVDWSAVSAGVGGLLTITLIATLALLLNVTALELISRSDADLNHELKSVGVANLVSSFTGSPAGYHALGPTALAVRLGVESRGVPVIVAAVCLAAAAGGTALVGLLPLPLVAGILMMLGLSFLLDWLVDGFSRMTGPEYLLMVAIAIAVATLGFLAAVLLGMTVAVILFAVTYSQIDPVRHMATGRERRSNIDRPAALERILDERGSAIVMVELQGFLFFGTARSVVNKIGQLIADTPELRCLILDLRRVPGIDSTALASFVRLGRLSGESGSGLIISDLPPHLERSLPAELTEPQGAVVVAPDLEHALEMAEELVLEGDSGVGSPLSEVFGADLWTRLEPYLERTEVGIGVIVDSGDRSIGLFLVDDGRVVTEIPATDGKWQRVRSSGRGAILGEMSIYLRGGRTARLRALEPTVLYTLDDATIARMESDDPLCALALHRLMATVLAERVAHGNDAIRALIR